MKILVLGPYSSLIQFAIESAIVSSFEGPIYNKLLVSKSPDLVISFGYRHLISREVLSGTSIPFLNIHISLLPWNRGADPNLWSWLENTPRGVSIHWISERLDRGDIFAQKQLVIDPYYTLRTSYELLMASAIELLQDNLSLVDNHHHFRQPQQPGGSFHKASDKTKYLVALHSGWDTPCKDVLTYGKRHGLWKLGGSEDL